MVSFISRAIHGPIYLNNSPVEHHRLYRFLVYLPDWIVSIVLLGLTAYYTDFPGFQRQFSLTDIDIQHTMAVVERIPFQFAIIYAGAVPAGIILIISLFWRRSFWDLHHGILGLLFSIATATVITDVIKVTIGRPRPDFLDRCQPIANAMDAIPYGLATIAQCTVKSGTIINDGFKSFPSGHSSFSFAGLTFLSLYLAGKMSLFNQRSSLLKAWIFVIPMLGAAMIAVSRVMDYRHRGTDVIAGGLLGFLMASFSYYLYYPSLYSPESYLPYPPRTPSSDSSTSSTVPSPTTPEIPLVNTQPYPLQYQGQTHYQGQGQNQSFPMHNGGGVGESPQGGHSNRNTYSPV